MIDWKSRETHVLLNPRAPGLDRARIESALHALRPLSAHVFVATSGSTAQVAGELKWVALSKEALLASASAVNAHLNSTASDVWAHALPEFHVGGLGIYARAFLSGARVVDALLEEDRRWDPRTFYSICVESKATLSALVPAQVYDLVQLGKAAPSSLRAMVIGGGALSEELYDAARALGYPVLPSYGATECCSQVATAQGEDPALRVLPHFAVTCDSAGRLRFRGPSLLTGYAILSPSGNRWIDPKQDGWFVSEDFGSIEGTHLKIRGRSADFVKIGGESVDLSALEKKLELLRLSTQPAFDVALIAIPDERLGHVIHAATSAHRGDSKAQAFFSRLNEQILPYERARELHFVEKIPRSPLGKLLRSELRDLIRR